MLDSYSDARSEIFDQLLTAKVGIASVIGYDPTLVFQGVPTDTKQLSDKFWYRISQQTVVEEQDTLRADYGGTQKRRYTTDGLVFVQIFVPISVVGSYQKGLQMAELVKGAYRGKETPNCIWFRNVRIQELPIEEPWMRLNVVAEYQYNQIG